MKPLIMDLGAHNGDDAAYYLFRGYRVVAVEANPVLAEQLRCRFAGQEVCVENVCIGPMDAARVPFWINLGNSTWSSFDREIAAREGTEVREVKVPAVTLGSLLERYGVPHYLKIDIEGMDEPCLKSLNPTSLPQYISLELSHAEDIIGGLERLGYERFKVINQESYTDSTPIFPHEIGWRLLRKTRLGKLLPTGLKQDFDRFNHGDWIFQEGCSGPFGEDTYGQWLSAGSAKDLHARIQQAFVRGRVPLAHCWYDVHATR